MKTLTEVQQRTIDFIQTRILEHWTGDRPYSTKHPQSFYGRSTQCVYNGANGAQCIAQQCIKTDLSEWEGSGITGIMNSVGTQLEWVDGLGGLDALDMAHVQTLHDEPGDAVDTLYSLRQRGLLMPRLEAWLERGNTPMRIPPVEDVDA